MSKKEKYELLASLFSHFKDKKWLLAKFLIDNDAINDSFIKKIQNSNPDEQYFYDIDQINEYFNNLINKETDISRVDLEKKLNDLIIQEKYEEAAKIRDWLKKIKK